MPQLSYSATPLPTNGQPRSATALAAVFNNILAAFNADDAVLAAATAAATGGTLVARRADGSADLAALALIPGTTGQQPLAVTGIAGFTAPYLSVKDAGGITMFAVSNAGAGTLHDALAIGGPLTVAGKQLTIATAGANQGLIDGAMVYGGTAPGTWSGGDLSGSGLAPVVTGVGFGTASATSAATIAAVAALVAAATPNRTANQLVERDSTGAAALDITGLATNVSGTVAPAHGGTGLGAPVPYGIFGLDAAGNGRQFLPPATPGYSFVSDGTQWTVGAPTIPDHTLGIVKMADCSVMPNTGSDLNAAIGPVRKYDALGRFLYSPGGTVSLAAQIPGVGQQRVVMAYYDQTYPTPQILLLAGTDFTGSLSSSNYPAVPNGGTVCGFILMHNGHAAIIATDILEGRGSIDTFFTPGASGGGGSFSSQGHVHGVAPELFIGAASLDPYRVRAATPTATMHVFMQPGIYTTTLGANFVSGALDSGDLTAHKPASGVAVVGISLANTGALTLTDGTGASGGAGYATAALALAARPAFPNADIAGAYAVLRSNSTAILDADDGGGANGYLVDARRWGAANIAAGGGGGSGGTVPTGGTGATAFGGGANGYIVDARRWGAANIAAGGGGGSGGTVATGGTGATAFGGTGTGPYLVYSPTGGTSNLAAFPFVTASNVGFGIGPTITPGGANADMASFGGIFATGSSPLSIARGLHVSAATKTGTGAISTMYGLDVEGPTIGTANVGARIQSAASLPASVPLVVNAGAGAGQSGHVQEWQLNGTPVGYVDNAGGLWGMNTGALGANVGTVVQRAVTRLERYGDGNPLSFTPARDTGIHIQRHDTADPGAGYIRSTLLLTQEEKSPHGDASPLMIHLRGTDNTSSSPADNFQSGIYVLGENVGPAWTSMYHADIWHGALTADGGNANNTSGAGTTTSGTTTVGLNMEMKRKTTNGVAVAAVLHTDSANSSAVTDTALLVTGENTSGTHGYFGEILSILSPIGGTGIRFYGSQGDPTQPLSYTALTSQFATAVRGIWLEAQMTVGFDMGGNNLRFDGGVGGIGAQHGGTGAYNAKDGIIWSADSIVTTRFDRNQGETVWWYGASKVGGFGAPNLWTNATMQNGFASNTATTRYKRSGANVVHLQGDVRAGGAAGSVIFTLPVGYRPNQQLYVPTYKYNGSGFGTSSPTHVVINTDGTVTCLDTLASDGGLKLNNISFPADQ